MKYRLKQNKRVYPIPYFSSYYISKSGDIWSIKRGKFLVPFNDGKTGHIRVHLFSKGKRYRKLVHRLVLAAFIGFCPSGMEACHNNGNPADNRVGNLRWDTRSNNTKDRVKHGTYKVIGQQGEDHGRAKLNETQVKIIRRLLNFNLLTQKEISKLFDVGISAISHIKLRHTWKHI